jgi:hypothetical protein
MGDQPLKDLNGAGMCILSITTKKRCKRDGHCSSRADVLGYIDFYNEEHVMSPSHQQGYEMIQSLGHESVQVQLSLKFLAIRSYLVM